MVRVKKFTNERSKAQLSLIWSFSLFATATFVAEFWVSDASAAENQLGRSSSRRVENVKANRGSLIFRVRNAQGKGKFVYCGLFDAKKSWPSKEVLGVRGRVNRNGEATCRFTSLPPGSYAIAAYHDANGNGELDTNWMGIPKEGWCTSRNVRPKWGAPKWEKARFRISGGKQQILRSSLNY